MSPFFLVQTAADAILLTLCALDLFRERLRRKDLLLPLLYAVMVAISRIRFTHSMDPLRTLLLPVDSLLCLFYLFILVLLLNSSWFSAPEGHTLWGTFLQLALFLLFRTGSAALLSVVRLDSGPWLICGTCLLSFLPWAALHTSGLMDWLQQRLAEGDIALQLLSVSTFVVLLLPWMLQLRRFGDYPWNQTALLLILLTGLDGAILMREQRQITQRRNMQFLEQYLPMVEELVESVRARQHAFSNRMMAVSAAVSVVVNAV